MTTTSSDLNNVTSTKQNLNDTTGIVVLAFNDDTKVYWHYRQAATATPQPPNANFTGAPTSGVSPLTVTFANTSTGTDPLTYAWDFGDPGSGANNTSVLENPSHTYVSAGRLHRQADGHRTTPAPTRRPGPATSRSRLRRSRASLARRPRGSRR